MLSLLLLLSCETTSTQYVPTCALALPTLSPDTVAGGSLVVATTGPLTAKNDTVVTVGAATASVASVDRTDCTACDDCRTSNSCTDCTSCDACATDCATCVETVTFIAPALDDGAYAVAVRNAHGQSPNVTLTVQAADSGLDSGADSGADSGGDSGD